jgi:DNA-directed RNA polymerase subunit RPC12/RpoP
MSNQPPPLDNPSIQKESGAPPTGHHFPCKKCGARLEFDPGSSGLKCPYCGYAEVVDPGNAAAAKRDLEEYLSKQTGKAHVEGRSSEVKCNACGAVVLLEDKVAADRCPYCAAFIENKPQAAQAMVAPDSVLPFAVKDYEASAKFSLWLASLWFAPSALRQAASLGKLNGVYVPFWCFDSMTYSHYSGERGDDYQETEWYDATETYTEDGQTKTRTVRKSRQVTKTRWTRVTGNVNHFFEDVTVCASESLPAHYSASLTPKEMSDLESFRPDYLTGFTTERYTLGPKEGFDKAQGIMEGKIRQMVCQDIGGNHQKINRLETQHVGVAFKHVLLPVWLASYRFQDKSYRVLVNGRTGQVLGDRPYSWAKILGLIGIILAVILAIVLIFAFASKARGAAVDAGQARPAPRVVKDRPRVAAPLDPLFLKFGSKWGEEFLTSNPITPRPAGRRKRGRSRCHYRVRGQ